jgi:hypothetical protein
MLSVEQARAIGQGFGMIVLSATLPAAAADEFFLTYPSMRTMDAEYRWFRPMMEVLATRQMESTPFGLKMRVGVGAVVSVGDMVSDLLMIIRYLSAGQNQAAYAAIGVDCDAFGFLLLAWRPTDRPTARTAVKLMP